LISFIARRLLATLPVLLIVAVLVFMVLRLAPGDPAAILAGDAASTEQIARIRAQLGLDRPLLAQFGIWVANIAGGDLGESFYYKMKVTSLIGQRLEPTLALATLTILIAIAVAVPMGVIAAWRFGGWFDRALMGFSVLGFSVPVFVIAYVLIMVFSIELEWLPVQGYRPISEGVWEWARHLILPSSALGTVYIALIARMTRASMLDVLAQDYVRTAQAKGLAPTAVLLSHALKNAAVPIATVVGIGVALLIGGAIVTETVFALPGIGRLTVDAILRRDYPIIQGVVLIFSGAYVLINLAVDLSYMLFDPRIRY
jgi:peptide/nickel transport system permease protein